MRLLLNNYGNILHHINIIVVKFWSTVLSACNLHGLKLCLCIHLMKQYKHVCVLKHVLCVCDLHYV